MWIPPTPVLTFRETQSVHRLRADAVPDAQSASSKAQLRRRRLRDVKVRVGVKVSAWHIELAAPGETPACGPAHAVSLEETRGGCSAKRAKRE